VNLRPAEEIAKAVLYEGYLLYPYRPSSVKNQQRFNFGVLAPPAYCEEQVGAESASMLAECLVRVTSETRLTVRVGFLQIVERLVGRFLNKGPEQSALDPNLEFVDCLEVDGHKYQPWQEGVERSYTCGEVSATLRRSTHLFDFEFPKDESVEILRSRDGWEAGAIVRRCATLGGSVAVRFEQCGSGIAKAAVRVDNQTAVDLRMLCPGARREAILPQALISAHMILGVENGEFLSLLEPPAGYEELTAQCENRGAWPVLANDEATLMLASPIILYDHPKIAPESAGDLFDATEIDEILSLRILTLTDEEKREIRQTDDRVRELLERTESIPSEQFMKMHGAWRGLRGAEGAQR
jgi:hypothetical protein